jgi:hypothetical protein
MESSRGANVTSCVYLVCCFIFRQAGPVFGETYGEIYHPRTGITDIYESLMVDKSNVPELNHKRVKKTMFGYRMKCALQYLELIVSIPKYAKVPALASFTVSVGLLNKDGVVATTPGQHNHCQLWLAPLLQSTRTILSRRRMW